MHATYTYDANGQRTRSVVRSGGTTTTTDWTYEGLTLLSVKATSTGSTTASWTIDYLYDGSGRPYAGVYRSGAEAAASFTFVTTDRGDVVGLLDKSGVGFAAYRYDAWGRSTSTTSQGTARIGMSAASEIAARSPLRYAGYCYDEESGLYYLSARHYDPVSMQFLTKDPAKADGEESAYQYCGGDPVGKVDPSGLVHIVFDRRDAEPWSVPGSKTKFWIRLRVRVFVFLPSCSDCHDGLPDEAPFVVVEGRAYALRSTGKARRIELRMYKLVGGKWSRWASGKGTPGAIPSKWKRMAYKHEVFKKAWPTIISVDARAVGSAVWTRGVVQITPKYF